MIQKKKKKKKNLSNYKYNLKVTNFNAILIICQKASQHI